MLLASVDGWTCAVKQGEHKVGELVLYFEIDSFLPAGDERFSFLKPFTTWQGQRGFHVKSTMVGKSISQGLILPVSTFTEATNTLEKLRQEQPYDEEVQKFMQLSFEEQLGVKKWELTPDEAKRSLGQPPTFIPKTDLERVQNCPNLFTPKYNHAIYQESVKMDGSSMTAYFVRRDSQWYKSVPALPKGSRADSEEGRVGVCSRKHDLPEVSDGKFWPVALDNYLPAKLKRLNRNIAVQGELCGSTISQNREGFDQGRHQFYVFRIFDIDEQKALCPKETVKLAGELGLEHVPVLGYVKLHDIAKSHNDLLKRSEGRGIHGKLREGLVYKNMKDGRSFKVISNSNLLRNGE
ncbi:hypothetical protein DL769_000051 [Monosporascus sp. CRB-8-3]|nr:hypothetical protein DL769_000051 [Monosporascus sp. CRB-8-3]